MSRTVVTILYLLVIARAAISMRRDDEYQPTIIFIGVLGALWAGWYVLLATLKPALDTMWLGVDAAVWNRLLHIPTAAFLIYLVHRIEWRRRQHSLKMERGTLK